MCTLFELTDEATGADIVNAELRLQQLPKIKMNPKKMESLQKKYDSIPPRMDNTGLIVLQYNTRRLVLYWYCYFRETQQY